MIVQQSFFIYWGSHSLGQAVVRSPRKNRTWNWELGTGNWELGTGDLELGTWNLAPGTGNLGLGAWLID